MSEGRSEREGRSESDGRTDGEGRAERSGSVFADRGALRPSNSPASMPERAATLDALEDALAPVLDGTASASVVLYAPPGGETTAVVDRIRPRLADGGGTVVALECTPQASAYTLGIDLANALDAGLPDSGLSFDAVRDAVESSVAELSGPLVVTLVDVDALPSDVRRAFVGDVVDPVRSQGVGVVAVSNDLALRNDLAPDEKTILCGREFPVADYDADELRGVVERRVDAAFVDDAVAEVSFDAVVERAVDHDTDVAYALAVLERAGEFADERDGAAVTTEDVAAAALAVDAAPIADIVGALDAHERSVLRGLVALGETDDLPARVDAIYSEYATACTEAGVEPNTERSVQNYLRSLTDTDLVTSEQVRTERGGQYYRYDLTVDVAALDGVLSSPEEVPD